MAFPLPPTNYLAELSREYQSRTGQALVSVEATFVSVSSQADRYDGRSVELPGCAYENYNYLSNDRTIVTIFDENTNFEVLNQILANRQGAWGPWKQLGEKRYVSENDRFYGAITKAIRELQQLTPPGLATQWKICRERILNYQQQALNLSAELDRLAQEMAALKTRYDEYITTYRRITSNASQQRREDIDARLTIDTTISSLEQQIRNIGDEITRILAAKQAKQNEIAALERRNTVLNPQIDNLTAQLSDLSNQYQVLLQDYAATYQKLEQVQHELDELARNGQRHTETYAVKLNYMYDLQSRLSDLETNINVLAQAYNLTENALSHATHEKSANNTKIQRLQREFEELITKESTLSSQRDALQRDLAAQINYRSQLDLRLQDIRAEILYLIDRRPDYLAYEEKARRSLGLRLALHLTQSSIFLSKQQQTQLLLAIENFIADALEQTMLNMMRTDGAARMSELLSKFTHLHDPSRIPGFSLGAPGLPPRPPFINEVARRLLEAPDGTSVAQFRASL